MHLASRFGTFFVPDCRVGHGRAYFGIPDFGKERVLYHTNMVAQTFS